MYQSNEESCKLNSHHKTALELGRHLPPGYFVKMKKTRGIEPIYQVAKTRYFERKNLILLWQERLEPF